MLIRNRIVLEVGLEGDVRGILAIDADVDVVVTGQEIGWVVNIVGTITVRSGCDLKY